MQYVWIFRKMYHLSPVRCGRWRGEEMHWRGALEHNRKEVKKWNLWWCPSKSPSCPTMVTLFLRLLVVWLVVEKQIRLVLLSAVPTRTDWSSQDQSNRVQKTTGHWLFQQSCLQEQVHVHRREAWVVSSKTVLFEERMRWCICSKTHEKEVKKWLAQFHSLKLPSWRVMEIQVSLDS